MGSDVKTDIDGLEIGMFISKLDRPWISTPFALEGFKIRSGEDIVAIRKHCQYVYVDVEQGITPKPRYWLLDMGVPKAITETWKPEKRPNQDEFRALRKTTYRTTQPFDKEIKVASRLSDALSQDYNQLLSDLERGRDLNLKVVEAGVSDMVESVSRNPNAMMWIVQLRKLDEYTYSRALGTSVWCATFGRHLGLDAKSINRLALGGLLLDLGKSRLPQDLLKKTGKLTDDERRVIYKHVQLGIRLLTEQCAQKNGDRIHNQILKMVATHHERFDGSGYPKALGNDEIPMFGRIAGIVDSYDAMTSERPYLSTRPLSPYEAIAELYNLRNSKFQPELVEQFIQTVGLYPSGSLVELNNGFVGTVIEVNSLRRLQPTLMLLLDEDKQPCSEFRRLDLTTAGESMQIKRGLEPGAFGINMQELFL